jgi:hypothetical protein
MKQTLLFAALFSSALVVAQDLPQPSPPGEVEQVVGLTKVEVEYSRPSAKGRKVFGELVPFDKVWRTGANMNTTIEVESDIQVEGSTLPAGKYSIFTTPGKEMWVVHFNKNVELWGEGDRKPEEDVLTVKVKPGTCDFTETFTITIGELADDNATLELRWENTKVPVKISADATRQALRNIEKAVNDPTADFRVFHNSARFLVDRKLDPAAALKYAQISVDKEMKFWNMHTLALAQAQNGKYATAIETAQKSMEMAQKVNYEAYVTMNKQKIEEWSKMK